MHCPRCHRQYRDDSQFCHYDGGELVAQPLIETIPAGKTRYAGDVLGDRYRIRGYIGKGSVARVYLAEDLQTGKPVAVKVLERILSRDKSSRERFLREARAIRDVDHPNVVQVFDVGMRDDGTPYLIMEFLLGETLGELLHREGILTTDIALPVIRQAAAALSAAHRAQVIHRDVKPDNLFLVGELGDPYAVKVLDFGFAKMPRTSGETAVGVAVGTIEYMAPEQVVTDPTHELTDVYGLGIVMYRMFSGRLPFSGIEQGELLAQQLAELPIAPSVHSKAVDRDIEAVILRAIRKNPTNRYESMQLMLEDIERLMGERPGLLLAHQKDRVPDFYRPATPFAQDAAMFLYRKLGKKLPPL